jgi:hypothetical protein
MGARAAGAAAPASTGAAPPAAAWRVWAGFFWDLPPSTGLAPSENPGTLVVSVPTLLPTVPTVVLTVPTLRTTVPTMGTTVPTMGTAVPTVLATVPTLLASVPILESCLDRPGVGGRAGSIRGAADPLSCAWCPFLPRGGSSPFLAAGVRPARRIIEGLAG